MKWGLWDGSVPQRTSCYAAACSVGHCAALHTKLDTKLAKCLPTCRPSCVTTATLPPAAVGPEMGCSWMLHASSPVRTERALRLRQRVRDGECHAEGARVGS